LQKSKFYMVMATRFGVSSFILDSGERYCLVVDRSTDLPLYYPNLFLTTQLRNKSDASATIEAAAANLVILLRFLDRRGIDLQERFLKRDFLKVHELDDLRDFSQRKLGNMSATAAAKSIFSLEELEESAGTVTNGTQYSRLTTIAGYIGWLAKHLLDSAGENVIKQIDVMEEQIKARRPSKRGRNNTRNKSLSDEQLETLFEVIRPKSEFNPFTAYVQRRNRLMVLVLYYLGIRRGELLNIRIRDIDFSKNQLEIVRRADEKDDLRSDQPKVKTRSRILPLSDALAKELHEFVAMDRRKIQNANRHDFLFVTYKAGKTVGQPITIAGYHKVVDVVRSVCPDLYAMTGHKLRHTWNRKFSEHMDSMGSPPSEERQEQIRSSLQGWKDGSGTASTYNKRFVEQKAYEAALSMQETSGIRLPVRVTSDD